MDSEIHNRQQNKTKLKRNMVGMIVLTFVLGGVVLGILGMNTRNALNMTEHHGQIIHAVMEIQYESTRFHLGLEELLLVNLTQNKNQVWQYLETAKLYAHAVLNGGDTGEGIVFRTNNPELRIYLEESLILLEQLDALAERRFSSVTKSTVDTALKTKFEITYDELQQHVEKIELLLREHITEQKKAYTLVAIIMGFIIFLGTILAAYLFYRYEQQRIKNILQIKNSEARKQVILDNMIDGVITIDDNGIINTVNLAVESIFAYPADEMIGRNLSLIAANPLAQMHDYYLKNYQQGNEAKVIGMERTFAARRKDGSIFPLELSISEVELEGHRMYTAIVRDISERKQAEEEIENHRQHLEVLVEERTNEMKASRDEAEKASQAKSEFLSHMSHELRTPMNAILGFAQMLKMDAEGFNKNQLDNVNEILDAGHHLLDLINEVLDLTKIESGRLEINMKEVIIDDIMQQSIALINPLATARHIDLIDHVMGKGHMVLADNTRLKQVLVNLLSNAVKYNCENGTIRLESELIDKQYLRISITDTGQGITAENIDKLFTPFERLDKLSNIEGAGIGLVITKHIAELMGGSIGVESTEGEGSTFWIELALTNQEAKGKLNG